MKKKLNLICLLLFVALFATVSLNIAGGVEGVHEAWYTVQEEEGNPAANKQTIREIYTLKLTPTEAGVYTDSIYNARQERWMPVQYSELLTKVENPISTGKMIMILGLSLTYLLALLFGLICFIKLIRNINRSLIFEWKNVHNLNYLGFSLLIAFFIGIALEYLNYSSVVELVRIPGYDLDWNTAIQTTNLILGLATLLIAEIFAIGLRLKEEQDLTI